MDDRIRFKHDVGKSVRDFNRQHPSEIEGLTAAAAELETAVDQMDELFSQFDTGKREAAAAKREKDRTLEALHRDFLLPIAAIARGNSELDPGLARRFRAPAKSLDKTAFIGAARAIRSLAEEHKAVFIRDGMPATFVEDFGKALEEYDVVAATANTNRQLHVQARAQLAAVAKRVMLLLKRMDGINRTRFRKDPHLYQAWLAARNVTWPVVNQARLEAGRRDKPAA
jgi:hypothetical protein